MYAGRHPFAGLYPASQMIFRNRTLIFCPLFGDGGGYFLELENHE
jgi:hypothetical protein